MRLELTRIGNSRGIRIPKPLIAQCGLGDVVELRVTPEGIVIAPHRAPREGWRDAFAAAHPAERLMLLDPALPNAFDGEDWKW
jgi:antitoxin MazE